MLRCNAVLRYRMSMGKMLVDFKITSRDHALSLRVEDAVVDPTRQHSIAPASWLEHLRSPTKRLPHGYYREVPVYVPPPSASKLELDAAEKLNAARVLPYHVNGSYGVNPVRERYLKQNPPTAQILSAASGRNDPESAALVAASKQPTNAIRAGPVVMYLVGEASPVVLDVDFVDDSRWALKASGQEDIDLRVGREAIEQCTLFTELRPGGLLSTEPLSVLADRGLMQVPLGTSPYAKRPWTRMKTYFVDELQRGSSHKEFVGHNVDEGRPWRFSQHSKWFRVGIWRDMTRTKSLNEGKQIYSSYQRTPQQAVPEIRHMAPTP